MSQLESTVPEREPEPRPGLLLPEQEYFNIGEACRILQVPAYTLRYWENQFPIFRPTRRPSGHRRFTRRDMETAHRIKDLLQNKRMTVAGARKALSRAQRAGRLPRPDGAAAPGTLKLLRRLREELRRIVDELT